jgi:hypothetical protein
MAAIVTSAYRPPEPPPWYVPRAMPEYARGVEGRSVTDEAARVAARWPGGSAYMAGLRETDEIDGPTRIGLAPYIRAAWNLLWTAFRHPFKTTEIDLATGRVVRHF